MYKKFLVLGLCVALSGCQSVALDGSKLVDKKIQEKTFSMNDMMDHSNHGAMMVKSDVEFIEMMIPHHEEAISTAKIVLEKTDNAELKKLAGDIVSAQMTEVGHMKNWYKELTGNEYSDKGVYKAMMPDLSELTGVELDESFMEGMISHHMGAIMMAKQLKNFSSNKGLLEMADNVISSQSQEIDLMNKLISAS